MPPSAGKKPLEWARRAREAFAASLDYIASEDPFTAKQVAKRVDKALALIQEQPEIGAPAAARGRRTFAIPNTGHSINYRETRNTIRILRWYRQRQNVRR